MEKTQKNTISKVIPIWQPIGFSTHQISKKTGSLFDTRATHTGTLDPLAQGVIVVLTGEKRYEKNVYSDSIKGYEFELVFGISTDSYDGMGMIQKEDFKSIEEKYLVRSIESLVGEYEQEAPMFSAIRYGGKRMFEWAHEGKFIKRKPRKKGHIHKATLLKLSEKSLKDIVEDIVLQNLNSIIGHFRQERIIKQWEDYSLQIKEDMNVPVARIYVETTRGIYVRAISQDISKALGVPGFVISLTRTKNGEYTQKHCKTLPDLFGASFDRNNFVSTFEIPNN